MCEDSTYLVGLVLHYCIKYKNKLNIQITEYIGFHFYIVVGYGYCGLNKPDLCVIIIHVNV